MLLYRDLAGAQCCSASRHHRCDSVRVLTGCTQLQQGAHAADAALGRRALYKAPMALCYWQLSHLLCLVAHVKITWTVADSGGSAPPVQACSGWLKRCIADRTPGVLGCLLCAEYLRVECVSGSCTALLCCFRDAAVPSPVPHWLWARRPPFPCGTEGGVGPAPSAFPAALSHSRHWWRVSRAVAQPPPFRHAARHLCELGDYAGVVGRGGEGRPAVRLDRWRHHVEHTATLLHSRAGCSWAAARGGVGKWRRLVCTAARASQRQ